MHHVITVYGTFAFFFFLLTSSFVFQLPCSNGMTVMMCGHKDIMDDDRRCSTMQHDTTHHDYNTTRYDNCDHNNMQHSDHDCNDNTTQCDNTTQPDSAYNTMCCNCIAVPLVAACLPSARTCSFIFFLLTSSFAIQSCGAMTATTTAAPHSMTLQPGQHAAQ
jgi:hypothetical protein